jgi:hypothetical protein
LTGDEKFFIKNSPWGDGFGESEKEWRAERF